MHGRSRIAVAELFLFYLPVRSLGGGERNRSESCRSRFARAYRDKEILLVFAFRKPQRLYVWCCKIKFSNESSKAKLWLVSNKKHFPALVIQMGKDNIRIPMSVLTTLRTSTSTTVRSSSTRTRSTMRTRTMVLHPASFRSLSLFQKTP